MPPRNPKKDTPVADGRLPQFEEHDVASCSLVIANAGDGLSQALEVEPTAWHHGDEVYVVLRGTVDQVNHKPIKKGNVKVLTRQHRLDTQEIFIVSQADVIGLVEDRRAELRRARDSMKGQGELPVED